MDLLNYIVWNPDEIAFRIGSYGVHWYAFCWMIGLLLAYVIVRYLYKHQKIADEKFDPLFLYCFLGIIVGARLGHCLFYEPDVFLTSWKKFIEMFLPIEFAADSWDWKMTGYRGLASHGGTIGIIIALWLYCRKYKMNIWTVMDNIAIATPTTACFIRLGNLMNSEIIGKPTDVPWAFIFEQVDQLPRHPGQLYEAIAYACFFFIMWYVYKKHSEKIGTGYFFGLVLTLIFTFRFFIEYTKDIQVDFESGMLFNLGQLLSVPFIIIGVLCMKGGKWLERLGAKPHETHEKKEK